MTRLSNVDTYISKAPAFAQEILIYLRETIHDTLPSVEEKIKWGVPFFELGNVIIGSMAGFKKHCVFTFWNGAMMDDPGNIMTLSANHGMGHLPKMYHIDDVPKSSIFKKYIQEAAKIKKNKSMNNKAKGKEILIPETLVNALEKNPIAKQQFENASSSYRKEYIEWVQSAKQQTTQLNRSNLAVDWITKGLSRNWKYQSRKDNNK